MKKFFAILVAVIAMLIVSAMAEGKLEVTEFTQFQLDKGDGKYNNYVYAAITNTGDTACKVKQVLVQHTDGNGNVFQEKKCNSIFPSTLQPGETAYMYSNESFKDIADPSVISVVVLVPEASGSGLDTVYYMDSTAEVQVTERDNDYSVLVDEILTNTTDALRMNPYVNFRVYDQNDELIYVTSIYFGNVGLMPDSPAVFRVGGIWDASKCWKIAGRVPTKVVPFAYTIK